MKQRIILSPVILEDVDFIVDVKTKASLWPYEDDIASDRDAVRKIWLKELIVIGINNT